MGSGVGATAAEDIEDSGEGSGVDWMDGVVGSEVGTAGSGVVGSGATGFGAVGSGATGFGAVGSGVETGAVGTGTTGSGAETGVCSGVGSAIEFEAGAGSEFGVGSGFGCGVILFGDPCPLGVKLLLSMMLLYYTFYV